jgi:hypothetical protein
MLKKTITYKDFDGNSCTEDLYFNMTRVELTEFAFDMPDDITKNINDPKDMDVEAAGVKIAEKLGSKGIFQFVKDLVHKAYGVRSEDGKRFIKSKQLSEEFSQTMAYDEFMMDLFSDDKKAADFVNAIVPAEMANQLNK